jgi:2,5-diketo-D-gluconate reductase A
MSCHLDASCLEDSGLGGAGTSRNWLIDTAAAYGNEQEVGEAIRWSGIERSEITVQTELWISDYGPQKTPVGFDVSLRRLGVDYVDVYLLH